MRAFLIVSHGDLAAGMKMSVEMVAGEREEVYSLGLTPAGGPAELEEKLDNLLPELEKYEDIFVFTDLYGGSPGTTVFMRLAMDPRVSIISGVNFPMVLTAVLTPGVDAEFLINEARNGILDLKASLTGMDDEEDE
ncbi:MAG: hypothetical protein GX760_03045 [Erysipelothrix sp.]|nr:hypothetical protein [Erysipelothrix sp.]